ELQSDNVSCISSNKLILLQTWKVASQECESYGWEEFNSGKYEMTDSSHVLIPDYGDKLGDKFSDKIWDLKGAGIFSIFPLGEKIRLNVLEDSMPCHGLPRETI
ncbi:hypothetical protein AVEN_147543-1, partial [Araneus ventricosus]